LPEKWLCPGWISFNLGLSSSELYVLYILPFLVLVLVLVLVVILIRYLVRYINCQV
jgi:hypothetical protein